MRSTTGVPVPPALGKPASYGELILDRRSALIAEMDPFAGERLLDVGCGNGAQTVRFTSFFRNVVGIDVAPEHIDAFRSVIADEQLENIRAVLYDGDRMPFPDAAFDAAVSIETLEHVADEGRTLREIHRVLRPGGVLVVSVPHKWWPFETHGANLPFLPWHRVPFFSWLPARLHRRFAKARIYTRRRIENLLAAHGFSVERVAYLKAPMDRIHWRPLRALLRGTVFAGVRTRIPFLAPSIVVRATRRG